MKCILFDTDKHENYYPFSLNHATFEVRMGAFTGIERIIKDNNLSISDMVLIVRDSIKAVVSERYPEALVNPKDLPETNMHVKWDESFSASYMLDYIAAKDYSLINDCLHFSMSIDGDYHESSVFVRKEHIHVSESAKISAGVILDASDGPIVIDKDALIDIGSLIKGPAYIGKKSIINPGTKLRGNVSIGPYCKIGGEVEDSTFHGYSNKQHDGYLGHSYIGEWVNLGANTNNSDLKNNYSSVRIQIGDKHIDTMSMFAGCMIGDYTKTAISTKINTGTYIGIGANVFGDGFQDKYIQSFSWGSTSKTDLNKFLKTLSVVKGRRSKSVSKSEMDIITKLYNSKKIEGL